MLEITLQAPAGGLSKDPIGFSGGDGNLYRYVGSDPVNHVDLNGHLACPAEPDIYSHLSYYQRALKIAEINSELLDGHNDYGDAYRHALTSQMIANETDPAFSAILGIGYEAIGLIKGEPIGEALMDVGNNLEGIRSSITNEPIIPDNLILKPIGVNRNGTTW